MERKEGACTNFFFIGFFLFGLIEKYGNATLEFRICYILTILHYK